MALSNADKEARDLFRSWLAELGLELKVDAVGNMLGIRPGKTQGPVVLTGSHLDTVGTGGLFDGSLGIVAAIEALTVLHENNLTTQLPVGIANFTNEEGVRYVPDMMGSLVWSGQLAVEDALAATAIDGTNTTVREALQRIGYAGTDNFAEVPLHSFVELHIEQGPVLEKEGVQIGAVNKVQGIYWTEYLIQGTSNHAGTTPMGMRHDAGFVAACVNHFLRELTKKMPQIRTTVGVTEVWPNLINVIPERARITTDVRTAFEPLLYEAQTLLDEHLKHLAAEEGVEVQANKLVRILPVSFHEQIVNTIAEVAEGYHLPFKKMASGAGHDAQMMASLCPAAMIFIPSVGGVSHNINEYSHPEDVTAGANVLLNTLLRLAGV